MHPEFSQRTKDTMDSFIMSLVEVAAKPGMISFATGLPDNNLLPTELIEEAARSVLEEGSAATLQYDMPTGYIPLREYIAKRCKKELGFDVDYKQVIMTNGSQECFDLLGKLFLDRGDRMIVENPGYLGALQSYSAYGPEFIGIDVGECGADIGQLEAALDRSPKLFYSIPNHQNPSGISYSAGNRRAVADCIKDSGCLLIEDDAYGELGYGGRVGPTMKSMIPEDTVLTGSFSKTIAPGMRIGWMVIPEWMNNDAGKGIEASSLQSNTFCQKLVYRFLEDNDYDSFLADLRKSYKAKKEFFMDAMADNVPDTLRWNNPEGGMFVWLRTPDGTDAMKFFDRLIENKLVTMPGRPFHVNGGENTIRLNFATPTEGQILEGTKILGRVCREMY